MAKRGATKELNHDNWNEEEEPEEAGTMARASKAELEKRVIIKAKRRNPTDAEGKSSAFSGFSGFGGIQAKPPASTFSFLAKTTAPVVVTNALTDTKSTEKNGNGVDSYTADIKKLNNEFAKWIQKCVEKNPLCVLTPIFEDYKTYLKEIETEKRKVQDSTVANILSAPITFGAKSTTDEKKTSDFGLPTSASTFKFGDAISNNTTNTNPSAASTFSFGNTLSSSSQKNTTDETPKFSFSNSSVSQTKTITEPIKPATFTGFGDLAPKPFSFGTSSTPFTFGNVTQTSSLTTTTTTKNDDNEAEDEEDQPPKVEFTPVVEDDSIYSKRCKVFVKVDKEFKDRGVGTLYIKSVEDEKKTQVIVRADTSLGNLLLNMLLTKETPTNRTGKNNVMIGTVVDGKPTSVLIRVKTGEDADDLLETLEKNKK